MFESFIDFCFAGLETDIEKLFAMILVLFVLNMFENIIVAVLEEGKRW